jgi:hypothetical protein
MDRSIICCTISATVHDHELAKPAARRSLPRMTRVRAVVHVAVDRSLDMRLLLVFPLLHDPRTRSMHRPVHTIYRAGTVYLIKSEYREPIICASLCSSQKRFDCPGWPYESRESNDNHTHALSLAAFRFIFLKTKFCSNLPTLRLMCLPRWTGAHMPSTPLHNPSSHLGSRMANFECKK